MNRTWLLFRLYYHCLNFRDIRGLNPLCCIPWDEVNAFAIMKLLIDAGANPPDHTIMQVIIITEINYGICTVFP